jgi:hypothetical protein
VLRPAVREGSLAVAAAVEDANRASVNDVCWPPFWQLLGGGGGRAAII